MTPNEIAERWAEMCRSAESAGAQALRILEAALLKAMNDCASMEADRNRWVDVAGERALQVEGHRMTIDQLRARLTPPSPLHGLVRVHGLHIIDSMSGKLREVCADYEEGPADGEVGLNAVWLGAHEIMSMITPEQDVALCKQILAHIEREEIEGAEL
jgi:hypothetical protein